MNVFDTTGKRLILILVFWFLCGCGSVANFFAKRTGQSTSTNERPPISISQDGTAIETDAPPSSLPSVLENSLEKRGGDYAVFRFETNVVNISIPDSLISGASSAGISHPEAATKVSGSFELDTHLYLAEENKLFIVEGWTLSVFEGRSVATALATVDLDPYISRNERGFPERTVVELHEASESGVIVLLKNDFSTETDDQLFRTRLVFLNDRGQVMNSIGEQGVLQIETQFPLTLRLANDNLFLLGGQFNPSTGTHDINLMHFDRAQEVFVTKLVLVGDRYGAGELDIVYDNRFGGYLLRFVAINSLGSNQNTYVTNLLKLSQDLVVDRAFGGSGVLSFDINADRQDAVFYEGMTLLNDGSIVLYGSFEQSPYGVVSSLCKVLPTGEIDSAFGTGGISLLFGYRLAHLETDVGGFRVFTVPRYYMPAAGFSLMEFAVSSQGIKSRDFTSHSIGSRPAESRDHGSYAWVRVSDDWLSFQVEHYIESERKSMIDLGFIKLRD